MAEVFYDITKPNSGVNYRWIQPPQPAYFITSLDQKGNVNCAGATLGTCVSVDMEFEAAGNFFYTLSLGYSDLPHVPGRQTAKNLEAHPECVVSYIGNHLFREAQVSCLPVPHGISEIDVMGLTELPSTHITPPGIKEALVNIEMKVVSATKLGQYYELFVCQAVGVSVDEDLLEKDKASRFHAGIVSMDPLFEITVAGENDCPPRIYLGKMDYESTRPLPSDFGPSRTFVGSFPDWMEDEVTRGMMTAEEREHILALNEKWRANADPSSNAEVKEELTRRLAALIPPEPKE